MSCNYLLYSNLCECNILAHTTRRIMVCYTVVYLVLSVVWSRCRILRFWDSQHVFLLNEIHHRSSYRKTSKPQSIFCLVTAENCLGRGQLHAITRQETVGRHLCCYNLTQSYSWVSISWRMGLLFHICHFGWCSLSCLNAIRYWSSCW